MMGSGDENEMSEDPKASVRHLNRKTILTLLVVCLCILSLFVWRPFFTNPATYKAQNDYLEAKLANANMLCLGTTSASFIVTLLPDDG